MKRSIGFNVEVIVDNIRINPSLNSNFIDFDKLEKTFESEKKKIKLQHEEEDSTKIDSDISIKKSSVIIDINGGLQIPHSYRRKTKQCIEHKHELTVKIYGYSKNNSELLYKFYNNIYQEVIYAVGDLVTFDEPNEYGYDFKWISNIEIHKYPNIIQLIKIHLNGIQKQITNENEFDHSIHFFLELLKEEILSKCKNQKHKNIPSLKSCKSNCKICELAQKFNYTITKFLEKNKDKDNDDNK